MLPCPTSSRRCSRPRWIAPFSDPDWLFEMKLDGYRVEAVVHDGRVQLWTRNHQDAARYFPELAAGKAGLDRGLRRDRGRRGGGARPGGRRRLQPAPGPDGPQGLWAAPRRAAAAPQATSPRRSARARRSSSTPSTCCTSTAARCWTCRSRTASGCSGASCASTPQVRYLTPRATRTARTSTRPRPQQGLEGIIAKLRRSPLRAGQPLARRGSRSRSGASRSWSWSATSPARAPTRTSARCSWRPEEGALRYAGEVGSGMDTRTRT